MTDDGDLRYDEPDDNRSWPLRVEDAARRAAGDGEATIVAMTGGHDIIVKPADSDRSDRWRCDKCEEVFYADNPNGCPFCGLGVSHDFIQCVEGSVGTVANGSDAGLNDDLADGDT